MISSLAEEFTEPFDLERFRAGEDVLFTCSYYKRIREFWYEEAGLLYTKGGHSIAFKNAQKFYQMLPLDAWISVKGKAPFVAKAGEWEYETVSGVINLAGYPTDRDPEYVWSNIKRARRIVKKVNSAQNSVVNQHELPRYKTLKDYRADFPCTCFVSAPCRNCEDGSLNAVVEEVLDNDELWALDATPQQVLTRRAYILYKIKHEPSEPYVGLRDGEIEEIAGEALAQMKPWWRK